MAELLDVAVVAGGECPLRAPGDLLRPQRGPRRGGSFGGTRGEPQPRRSCRHDGGTWQSRAAFSLQEPPSSRCSCWSTTFRVFVFTSSNNLIQYL